VFFWGVAPGRRRRSPPFASSSRSSHNPPPLPTKNQHHHTPINNNSRSRILDIKTLEEDPGAAQEFARSKAEARKEGLTGVEFSDVAGLDPILNEVLEVVDFLKDPKAYSALGARPPKGILFEGDPGTGKTLLAKALAGEAMVPFYQMAGTEFTEGIVGVGAARVRDLFKRARAAAPCVIFVDEIDALGLRRAKGENKANEEREQTLNQLLTEMDGFTPDVGVVFLAATNRADLLDPALMRPGRFDRKVHMPRPDTMGRYDILRLQLRGRPVSRDVDLQQLARDLPGLAGADLANVINEAALHAVRCGRGDPSEPLTLEDIYAGVDRYALGETRPALPTSSKVPVLGCCAREVGICLVAGALRTASGRIEQVERVSIVPKGRSLSRTMYARGHDEQYAFLTRGHLLDRIKLALAPAVAARVVFGEDTNFARAGIVRATRLADKMVHYFGLSDMGVTTWAFKPYAQRTVKRGKLKARPNKVVSMGALMAGAEWASKGEDWRFGPFAPSDVTVHRYGDEVARIVRECYDEVWELVQRRRRALWAGIEALAQRREMQGRELRAIFERYPADALLASEEGAEGGAGAAVPRLALGGEEALRMSAEAEEARRLRREARKAAGGSDDVDSSDDDEDEEEDEALLQAAAELAAARPQQLDVLPFTKGRTDVWPFGIEWLDDAVARPYWVRYREAAERIARETGLKESDAEVQRRAAEEAAAACPGHRESDGRDRLAVGASLPGGSAERAAQVAAMYGESPGPGYKSKRRLE
jgi:ATP-dependent metalloprotease FtsH